MTLHRNQLVALAGAIERVARLDMPADAALSAYFRGHGEMGARDRAFVSDGAFAYLRRKASLEALAQTTEPRPLAYAVAVREFGHSVRDIEPAINAADARWLAGFKGRLHEPLAPVVAADVPDWLWHRPRWPCRHCARPKPVLVERTRNPRRPQRSAAPARRRGPAPGNWSAL